MRKRFKRIFSAALAGIVMCTAITFYPVETKAAAEATTDVWKDVSSADWMSYLDDSLKISEINLPGTHDSGTKNAGSFLTSASATCQSTNIAKQLDDGVRFLDIRLNNDGEKLRLVHSSEACESDNGGNLYLDEVLQNCYDFLDAHPGETIVMSMKKDAGNATDAQIETYIHNYINENSKYWYLDNTTPALSDVRGKIVLMRRYYHAQGDDNHEFENGYGVRIFWSDQGDSTVVTPPWAGPIKVTRYGWVQYCVQDRYKYSNDNKWAAIQQGLDSPAHTTNQKVGDIYITPQTTYFLNFMSTAGGGTPKSSANTINPKFQNYDMEYGKNYGWIIMDFATEALAKHVYSSNKSPKLEVSSTINSLNIPDTVESDMVLPTTGEATGGAAGTSISWSCDPANALTTTGGKYILVRQSSEQNITLTATVSSGNCSQQKEFEVLLKALPEAFVELNTALVKAETILNDPANAKYNLDSLETAVETARALMQEDANKVSETQIGAAMETLNILMDRGFDLKSTKELRKNLLGWYPLTASGKDVSGNHNNGTATGVTFSKDGATFTDSGKKQSYISLPTEMFDGKEQMTISFWAKDTKSSGSNTVFGIGSGTEPDGNNSAGVYKYVLINTNNTVKVDNVDRNHILKAVITKNTWRDERGFKGAECSFPANEWAHIACVFDGTKLTLYKNGTLIETKDTGIKLTDIGKNTVAYIGNSIWTNNDVDYSGSVKDFRVYDCVIAPELIKEIYNDKDMDYSSDSGHLVARYPLTKDSKNAVGKSNDGVATGVAFSPSDGATFNDKGKKQSYISLPTAMFDGEEQMTFSFWAKDTKSSGSNTVFGIGSGTEPDDEKSANIYKYVLINTNNGRKLKAVITKTSWHEEKGFFEECSFPANEWAHVTCVFDGTKFTLYKNGTLIGTKDTGIKLTDIGKNTVAYIGNSIWTNNDVDYSGSVKDFRIYDCALSETEAKGLMNESIKDEAMESLMAELDLDITKEEDGSLSMSITDAITLPTTVSGGTISWSSDKTEVIDNTGKVTLPGADEDIQNVTLTASVTINGKTTEITFHCEVFTKLDIDTADLQAIISSVETTTAGLNQADYTASSWNAYQEALDAAKQQIKKPTSEEDVSAAADDLQAKKNAFVKLGDKKALNALINTVKSLNQAEYTTATWTALKEALKAAEETAKSNDVSQDDVDTAKNNLSAKKDALVKRGDKTNLNKSIAAAKALDPEDYTSDTWTSLQETLAEVENTAADIDAIAADIDAAEKLLKGAVDALQKVTYTVTFQSDNGSDDITKTVERKGKVTAPEEQPEKEGYIFDGWFEADAEEAFDFENTSIMSNVTLTAKWAAKRIVTFDPDNDSEPWTVEVKDGGTVTKPNTPQKEGYGFEYWYAEEEDTAFDFANTPITEDITLTAKWTEGHTVTFDPDNDSESWTVVVEDGGKVSIPETTPEKEGYEFEYWYAEEEDTAFDFANTPITEDITLTAKWKEEGSGGDQEDESVVTFNPDNGSDPWTATVTNGENVTRPDTPEKEGYEFEYWYAEGEDGAFDFENTPITEDITLIAKWKEKQKEEQKEDPVPVSLTSATIGLSKTTFEYNGKEQRPQVTVTCNGKQLTVGIDYVVSYSNNKKVGLGTVMITGKGNYSGQKTAEFTIMPQKNNISKLTNKAGKKLLVKLSKSTKKTGAKGYEISYSLKKNFKGAKKVTTTKTSYTLKKLKKGKTYYVRVRSYAKIGKDTKYSAYSKVMKKKITK